MEAIMLVQYDPPFPNIEPSCANQIFLPGSLHLEQERDISL